MLSKNAWQSELLSLWQKGLNSPAGLSIKTDDRQLLRQQLYGARADYQGEEFDCLVILASKDEQELVIVRRDQG